jgi:hypothetical protein
VALKKAEMEAHRDAYLAILSSVYRAIQRGAYQEAVDIAQTSWPYIDGMMQYARKYEERDFASVELIDVVLKYAPLLFDIKSLDSIDGLLDEQRRIERNTSKDLGDELNAAKSRMWDAHRLWNHLERHPEARQDELRATLGGNQESWRSVAEVWEKMGLIRRTPEAGSYRLALVTSLDAVVPGKCPACGHIATAPKAALLEELGCTQCKTTVLHVLLS